jgi:hypothetical protein
MTATDDLVHYRIPGDASASTLCGLDAYDEHDDVARTDEAGTATCPACREAADEEPVNGVGSNTGHGHVWERPDGMKARCGGPGLCDVCSRALAAVKAWAQR